MWAAGDGKDHSFYYNSSASDELGYGLVHFSSVRSVHDVLRSNYFVSTFAEKFSWPAFGF